MLFKLKKLRMVDERFKVLQVTDINEWISHFNDFSIIFNKVTQQYRYWLKETKLDKKKTPCKVDLVEICRKYNIKKDLSLKCNDLQTKIENFFVEKDKEIVQYSLARAHLWLYLRSCHCYIQQLQGNREIGPDSEFYYLYNFINTDNVPVNQRLIIHGFEYNPNVYSFVEFGCNDILEVICKKIPIADIGRMMQVCPRFKRGIQGNNALWKFLCQRDLCVRTGRECSNWFLFYKNWFTKKTKKSTWFSKDVSGKLYHIFDGLIGIFHSDMNYVEIEKQGFVYSRQNMNPESFNDFQNQNFKEFFFNDDGFLLGDNLKYCTIFRKKEQAYEFVGRRPRKQDIKFQGNHNGYVIQSKFYCNGIPFSKITNSFDPLFGVQFDNDRLYIPNNPLAYRWGNYYYGLAKVSEGEGQYFVYCCNIKSHYMFRYLSDVINFRPGEIPEKIWIDSERIFIQTNKNFWILK